MKSENKRFSLKLIYDGNPLGSQWHAIDEKGSIISRSFGKWIAKRDAESKGYTMESGGTLATHPTNPPVK